MIKDITFVIAVRKGSKRVKNKNIKNFANTSLLEIKLKQIKRLFKKPNILLSSNCSKSIQIAKRFTKNIDKRPDYFCTDKIPMKKVYKYLASHVKTQYICYLHVTSPLLRDKTLFKTINIKNKVLKKNNKYDSITTVTKVQEYLWYKNKAINYDSSNHPRSQSLPKFNALNFAINIIEKKKMLNEGRIVGKKFYPIMLEYPENIDVDEQWQFQVAELLYLKFKKKIYSN